MTEAPTVHEFLVSMVKRRMEQDGLTQVEVATGLGISQKHLSQMLSGKVNGTIDMWQRLLDYLGTGVGERLSEVWIDCAEQTADWMWNNPGNTGGPVDPPRNPYDA